jgi:GNAT superfamily N-acetyltransferase
MRELPTSSVAIRLATVEDAQGIAEAHVASWQATYAGTVPEPYLNALSVEEFADRWRTHIVTPSGVSVYVADSGEAICGFAAGGAARTEITGFPGELYALYLLPEQHSKGIGARLFWTVAASLHVAGHRGMYAWVLAENPSCGFYEKMGGSRLSSAEIEIGGKCLKEISYGWADLSAAPDQVTAAP